MTRVRLQRARALEAVAHPAHARDATLAELAAEVPHVHVDDVRPRIEVVAPDVAQELLARQHLTGVAEEGVRERELPGAQADDLLTDDGLPRPEIERRVSDLEDGGLRGFGLRAAEHARAREAPRS